MPVSSTKGGDVNFNEFVVEIRLTLNSMRERLDDLEMQSRARGGHDWRLWLSIIVVIAGSITWAWTQITVAVDQKLIPIQQSLAYSQQDRANIISKLTEESDDRKDDTARLEALRNGDIKRIDSQLETRQQWFTEIAKELARSQERSETERREIDLIFKALDERTKERYTASQQATYAQSVEMRLKNLESAQ